MALREPVSKELVVKSGLPLQNVRDGGDTAWLVTPALRTTSHASLQLPWLDNILQTKRPLVAITVRELAPFDKRLNTTQLAYETAFANVVTGLIAAGYTVIAASTCTGIDSYHRDDRMNALRIGELVKDPAHFHVVMDELNDVQLGQLFAQCKLVVGTRLHSAIISMNFGTPAVAINYEHKSQGIMQQLGVPRLSQPVSALLDGTLATHVMGLLADIAPLAAEVQAAVERERSRTSTMVRSALDQIRTPKSGV